MTPAGADLVGLFPSFAPADIGGIQSSGRVGWQGLVERGWGNPHLLTYGRDERPATGATGTLGASTRAGAIRAARRIRGDESVIVVWHLALLRLVPFLRIANPRVVQFLHGVEAWRRLDRVTRALLGRARLILTNSDHTWARFVAANPALGSIPHTTVHLGLGEPAQGPVPDPDTTPTAVMIARLRRSEDYKGHREMISAWPLVLASVPDAKLWIVGEGDLRRPLEALAASLGVSAHVRFWGRVSEADKARLLVASRCLALPSRGEGFGLVYVEAMRLGRPCIVGRDDAGPEVVAPPEAGRAVDPASPPDIASAVGRLLTDEREWRRSSRGARARYERSFTAAAFQARLRAALDGI